jgi:hypothetical protein
MEDNMTLDNPHIHLSRLDSLRRAGRISLALGMVATLAALTRLIPGDEARPPIGLFVGFAVVAVLLLMLGAALLVSGRLPPEARSGPLALARAEQTGRRRQIAYLLMPLSLALQLLGVTQAARHAGEGLAPRRIEIFEVVCFLIFLLLFAVLIGGRGLDRWACPAVEDELAQAFRAQALRLGYVLLLPGLAMLVVLGLFNRTLALELAPVVAAIGVAGPAVRLFLLERAAGEGVEA